MNWLDIIIIIILVGAAIGGFANGLIRALFSLAGLIIGVVLAGRFYITLSGYLSFISNENAARIIAFLIIFLAVMIVAAILGVLFTKLISAVLLGWLNRLLGAAFGVIIGSIFVAAILALWVKYAGGGNTVSGSLLATFLLDRLPLILGLLPQEFDTVREFFQ